MVEENQTPEQGATQEEEKPVSAFDPQAWVQTDEGKAFLQEQQKGLYRALNQKEAELQRARQERETDRSSLLSLKQDIEELKDGLAYLTDLQAGVAIETPQESAQERRRKQKEAKQPPTAPINPVAAFYWAEIMADCEEAGITVEAVAQDAQVQAFGQQGKYRQARKRAQEIIAEAQKPKVDEAQVEKMAEERAEKRFQERIKKAGIKEPETGAPSGSRRWTLAQVQKLQETPEGLKEFMAHEREIMEAMDKGELK